MKGGEVWKPNEKIGIGEIVQMLLQIFMFCGRLAETAAGDDVMHIEITLAPTEGRSLFSDFPLRHIYSGYKADVDRIFLKYELPRVELLARLDALTAEASTCVFEEFDFKPSASVIRELIAEVRKS